MVEPRVGTRAQQRRILALLLAIAALVLPVSGAISYLDFLNDDGQGLARWVVPFFGGANSSDLVGPILLAAALGLGVVSIRSDSAAAGGSVSRSLLASILVVAAISQGAAFVVTAYDLIAADSFAYPGEAAWQAARWATVVRLGVQAGLCVAVTAYGMRWLNPADGRNSS